MSLEALNRVIPDRAEFRRLAEEADLIPVYRTLPFDEETAVSAYVKLGVAPFGFLLESVVGGEKWARYSFLGVGAVRAWRLLDRRQEIWSPGEGWRPAGPTDDPLAAFESAMPGRRVASLPGLPRFWGGAVGYFGYDVARFFERLPPGPPRDLQVPDALLLFTDVVIAVDRLFDRALVIAAASTDGLSPDEAYDDAVDRIDATISIMRGGRAPGPLHIEPAAPEPEWTSSFERGDFEDHVERIREYIHAGDAFQVVLSQRLTTALRAEPFRVYRALRTLNPSPYLFFLDLDGVQLIGSSPEVMVRSEGGRVTVRPIAGTRRRGRSEGEDRQLEAELLADEKERAEHLMLVDLGRNDVGRVARYGSVSVPEFMTVERYSHVMHLSSTVTGRLREGLDAWDALRNTLPVGTVSGAPKVRAMQIIDEMEPTRRGPYAGGIGFVSLDGNMDMALALRTMVIPTNLQARDGWMVHLQAGAGIVADSDPAKEHEETVSKAAALARAIDLAERAFC